jgi:hypothetical protein
MRHVSQFHDSLTKARPGPLHLRKASPRIVAGGFQVGRLFTRAWRQIGYIQHGYNTNLMTLHVEGARPGGFHGGQRKPDAWFVVSSHSQWRK